MASSKGGGKVLLGGYYLQIDLADIPILQYHYLWLYSFVTLELSV